MVPPPPLLREPPPGGSPFPPRVSTRAPVERSVEVCCPYGHLAHPTAGDVALRPAPRRDAAGGAGGGSDELVANATGGAPTGSDRGSTELRRTRRARDRRSPHRLRPRLKTPTAAQADRRSGRQRFDPVEIASAEFAHVGGVHVAHGAVDAVGRDQQRARVRAPCRCCRGAIRPRGSEARRCGCPERAPPIRDRGTGRRC